MTGAGGGPTISVAIAAYQAERWIATAVESILGQTVAPLELIVVDDGSTDGTAAILAGFGDRIRTISQPNGGAARAFNRAFAAARGHYVAFCGADDVWEPRKLEWQLEALRGDPAIDVAIGHASTFGAVEEEFARPADTAGILDNGRFTALMYDPGNVVAAPSAVVRRSLFERLGGLVEGHDAEDYELWMSAVGAGAVFWYDPRLLVRCLRHGDNVSWGDRARLRMFRAAERVHRDHAGLVDRRTARRVLARDRFRVARHLVEHGSPAAARREFVAAAALRPTPRAIAWALLLWLPAAVRRPLAAVAVRARRSIRPFFRLVKAAGRE